MVKGKSKKKSLDRHQVADYYSMGILMLWTLCIIRIVIMNRIEGKLERKLDGYADFLRRRRLAQPKHQPHLVQWVREFLIFAAEHRGHTFEQTLALFLTTLGKRTGIKPWQIRQAADAVRIYRYQYQADAGEAGEEEAKKVWTGNEDGLLAQMREIIRLRHYAKNTEKTYLHWTRRFLGYRKQAGLTGEPAAADVKAFLTRLAMAKIGPGSRLSLLPAYKICLKFFCFL